MTKTAWVIGASTGIGRELALQLAAKGVKVVVSARNAEALKELENEAPDRIAAVPLDVLDEDTLEATIEQMKIRFGEIDLLVYSAAYWRMGGMADTDTQTLAKTIETNVVAPYRIIKLAVERTLLANAATLALLSSVAGFNGLPNAVAYGTSKAALTHMAESLRFEMDDLGYRIVVVHPGFVATPMTADNPFPMPFLMSAERAAARILKGLDGNGFEITFPRRLSWALKLIRMLPYAVSYPLLKRATAGKPSP